LSDKEKIIISIIFLSLLIIFLLISLVYWIIKKIRNNSTKLLNSKESSSSNISGNDAITNQQRMNIKQETSNRILIGSNQNYEEFKDSKPSNIVIIIK